MSSAEELVEMGLSKGLIDCAIAGHDANIWAKNTSCTVTTSEIAILIELLTEGEQPEGNMVTIGGEKHVIVRQLENNFVFTSCIARNGKGAGIFKFSVGIIIGVYSTNSGNWVFLPANQVSDIVHEIATVLSKAVSNPAKSARK